MLSSFIGNSQDWYNKICLDVPDIEKEGEHLNFIFSKCKTRMCDFNVEQDLISIWKAMMILMNETSEKADQLIKEMCY